MINIYGIDGKLVLKEYQVQINKIILYFQDYLHLINHYNKKLQIIYINIKLLIIFIHLIQQVLLKIQFNNKL